MIDQNLFIFGGHDIREGSHDNLWKLDLNTLVDLDNYGDEKMFTCQWEPVEVKGKLQPGRVSHHSSVIHKSKMYLFGGNTLKEASKDDNCVFELDF